MVVCQYFLEGRCHFGRNCRNEHIYNNSNDGKGGRNSSSNQGNNVFWQISNEVVAAEKGGQWPLSSFAPIKEGPCLPGWEDVSPEEVRWMLYNAQKNNTVNEALNQISQLYKNAENARNSLKQPSPEILQLLNDILKGKKLSNSGTSSNNVFGSPVGSAKSTFRFDTAVNNIFQQPSSGGSSIFGGSAPSYTERNIFGKPVEFPPQDSTGSSVFTRTQPSSQNIFSNSENVSQNIFTSSSSNGVSSNQNIFSGSNPPTQNVFQSQLNSNIFSNSSTNFFGGNVTSPNAQSNQSLNSFGVSLPRTEAAVSAIDSVVYSKIEDLHENEIKAFTATTFAFGKIPTKPPPKQFC